MSTRPTRREVAIMQLKEQASQRLETQRNTGEWSTSDELLEAALQALEHADEGTTSAAQMSWTPATATQLARTCRSSRWTIHSADDYSGYIIDSRQHATPRELLSEHAFNVAAARGGRYEGIADADEQVRAEILETLEDYYYGWGDVMGTAGTDNYPTYCNIVLTALLNGERPDEDTLNITALTGLQTFNSQAEYENETIIKFLLERDHIATRADLFDEYNINWITDETLGHIGNKFFLRDPENFLNIIENHHC